VRSCTVLCERSLRMAESADVFDAASLASARPWVCCSLYSVAATAGMVAARESHERRHCVRGLRVSAWIVCCGQRCVICIFAIFSLPLYSSAFAPPSIFWLRLIPLQPAVSIARWVELGRRCSPLSRRRRQGAGIGAAHRLALARRYACSLHQKRARAILVALCGRVSALGFVLVVAHLKACV
jgi:hypothetical protein